MTPSSPIHVRPSWTVEPILDWAAYTARVRARGCTQLCNLERFTDPILIAGCQRSGTTMLARLLTSAPGMVTYQFNRDDELDAACLLCGAAETDAGAGRFCFQTTYLNECVGEYAEHRNKFKLIWVLRNPYSVVRSMVSNWSRGALNRLFTGVALQEMREDEARRYQRFGRLGIGRFRKACLAYVAKSAQVFQLADALSRDELFLVDYDHLVENKMLVLPELFKFLDLEYNPGLADKIHAGSIGKASGLRRSRRLAVTETCLPVYERALDLLHNWHGD